MKTTLRKFLFSIASSQFALVLMSLAMLLVYSGTWAQVHLDDWQVQKNYFHSLVVWVPLAVFLPPQGPQQTMPTIGFPLPGGYSLGALWLVNLLAALVLRFNYTIKHIGVLMIHAGLIFLIVGEIITSQLGVEGKMSIEQGQSSNFVESTRQIELAVWTTTASGQDQVTSIPASRLESREPITVYDLPFTIRVDDYYSNAIISRDEQGQLTAVAKPTERGQIAEPAVKVSVAQGAQSLSQGLLSTDPDQSQPIEVELPDKIYYLQLRHRRTYLPYTIHLQKFTQEQYTGTKMARSYSSEVRLTDAETGEDHETRIWMNHPLRYRGQTFYQAGVLMGNQGTILQVVSNPGRWIPYIACTIGGVGLLVHFLMALTGFVQNPVSEQLANGSKPQVAGGGSGARWAITPVIVVLAGVVLAARPDRAMQAPADPGAPASAPGAFDLDKFGRWPVNYGGRPQPLDSVARDTLRAISGRDTFALDGERWPAIRWMIQTMAQQSDVDDLAVGGAAATRPGGSAVDDAVFRIDQPEVLGALGLSPDQKLFSFRQLCEQGRAARLRQEARAALAVAPAKRGMYQEKMIELRENVRMYKRIARPRNLYLLAPSPESGEWRQLKTEAADPLARRFDKLIEDYRHGDAAAFNADLAEARQITQSRMVNLPRIDFEAFFNRFDPFMVCIVFYLLAFLLAIFSWMVWKEPLARSAFWLLTLTVILHTLALIGRMWISGRPPVTDLYSSAVFIGAGAVALALILERSFRNGIGAATGSLIGLLTLLVAFGLAKHDADTMKVLPAVLDTNFWLSTHVITVTLGYTATFLAGFLGMVYVLRGLFSQSLRGEAGESLPRMIYGIVCFAMFFSFLGTVLGGIWADQSWGRFWGWDPKENGAMLVVLWNAIILHARWAGVARKRGVAVMAIFGNIVTAWSWFGTNMLGVGLHSYGFMNQALIYLLAFVASQFLLVILGALPLSIWRSFPSSLHGAPSPATSFRP